MEVARGRSPEPGPSQSHARRGFSTWPGLPAPAPTTRTPRRGTVSENRGASSAQRPWRLPPGPSDRACAQNLATSPYR
jgi:hypothetical protein